MTIVLPIATGGDKFKLNIVLGGQKNQLYSVFD